MDIFELIEFTKANVICKSSSNKEIATLYTDTRKILITDNALFIALSTSNRNGNDFVKEAYAKGVRNFLVSEKIILKNANVLLVNDTLEAFQKLVSAKRKKFKIPIIAITGSNGKTIVKEWISFLLSSEKQVIKSPRSYNSQIGVPLSVWNISEKDEIGVFEAGISTKNEMHKLHKIIAPTFGIFTNIGTAHNEGFDSIYQKIAEKLKLFKGVKRLILNSEYENIVAEAQKVKIPLFLWSVSDKNADLYVEKIVSENNQTAIYFTFNKKEKHLVKINYTDKASIENAINCLAFLVFYMPSSIWVKQFALFEQLPEIEMRLQLKEGINNCVVIDDTYTNDLVGLENALEYQSKHSNGLKKSIIISDFLESGSDKNNLYKQVSKLLLNKKINTVLAVGKEISNTKISKNIIFKKFKTTDELLKKVDFSHFENECILIKGARIFQFEKIVQKLQKKQHETTLHIDLEALSNNLSIYKNTLKPATKIMAMVKAFSYGAGTYEIAAWLQTQRVDYLAVAYTDEGILLRQKGIRLPIMVMNPEKNAFNGILEYNLEPDMYSLRILDEYIEAVKIAKLPNKTVHIELDTGMHRLGFSENDLPILIEKLKKHKIKIASIFSHLVGSDDKNLDNFSLKQIAHFEKMAKVIENKLGYQINKHILNSAGIIAFPQYQMEMVRLGIGLYGIDPRNEITNLTQVATLKTTISQIFDLAKNETVGYNRKGRLNKKSRIATIALGYADGYDRRFGNGVGEVLVNGKKAPTIGNICMDMTMIDITDINAKEGDEVIVFGKDLSIELLASKINTIPYEILTNVSQRVKRIFHSL